VLFALPTRQFAYLLTTVLCARVTTAVRHASLIAILMSFQMILAVGVRKILVAILILEMNQNQILSIHFNNKSN
jgi:hypothetical protein